MLLYFIQKPGGGGVVVPNPGGGFVKPGGLELLLLKAGNSSK